MNLDRKRKLIVVIEKASINKVNANTFVYYNLYGKVILNN
jgi:hypothetical protein